MGINKLEKVVTDYHLGKITPGELLDATIEAVNGKESVEVVRFIESGIHQVDWLTIKVVSNAIKRTVRY